jgi:hypothetical protein
MKSTDSMTRADMARLMAEVFTVGNGPVVLDHLDALFRARATYVAGGIESQRETERRAAHKEVIDYVMAMIQFAQEGEPSDARVSFDPNP